MKSAKKTKDSLKKELSQSYKKTKKQKIPKLTKKAQVKILNQITKEKIALEEKILVRECQTKRLPVKAALIYLESNKHKMGITKYYEIIEIVNKEKEIRINRFALDNEFAESHLDVIDTQNLLIKEHWLNYHTTSSKSIKTNILKAIDEAKFHHQNALDEMASVIKKQAELKKLVATDAQTNV